MDRALSVIPAGTMLYVSSGTYSDYRIIGIFKANKDVDVQALRDKWLEEHPRQSLEYEFNDDAFLANIVRMGIISEVDAYEFHLSDYETISEMWVRT